MQRMRYMHSAAHALVGPPGLASQSHYNPFPSRPWYVQQIREEKRNEIQVLEYYIALLLVSLDQELELELGILL